MLIPVDVTGLGHTTLSIPHRVRSNVLSRASDDAVPAKVFLAPMSVVPGAAHTQRRHTTLSILPPATVRFPHWDGSPRCKHRGVVCKAIRAYSRCPRWVYRRLLCGGCTGTGALDVFTPIHRPFEFFSKSQRTSPMENFSMSRHLKRSK